MTLPLIPVALGLAGMAAAAATFVRIVVAIRADDRAMVARHLQAMQARTRRCS